MSYFHRAAQSMIALCFLCLFCLFTLSVPVAHAAANDGVIVYTAGDIADCKKLPAAKTMAARTAALITAGIAQHPDALVITLGDNVYPTGHMKYFVNCYDPTWGQFKERTLAAPGNHDETDGTITDYYTYFGKAAGTTRRGYYQTMVGKWRVYSLNSNAEGKEMQRQRAWLKQELARNKQDQCTLAFWHHPYISSGGHGSNPFMRDIWQLLQDADADLILAGHDHNYERLAPTTADGKLDDKKGIRSFVVGTGGAFLSPMFFPKPQTEARDNSTYGVLKLTLHERSYEWEFLPVGGKGFTDKGRGDCH
jgi:acid phosphatase type 7